MAIKSVTIDNRSALVATMPDSDLIKIVFEDGEIRFASPAKSSKGESIMPLSAAHGPSAWIDDFVHSTDDRFKGKSKKKRTQMALAAYYAKKRESLGNMFSPVLRALSLIEASVGLDTGRSVGRSVVSSSPPAGLKQPAVSGQYVSGSNAALTAPTSNAPMSSTPNNLNKPTLDAGTVAGPVLPSPIPNPPHTSALTTSADSLMSTSDKDTHVTGGSDAHMSSPRTLSNNLAKKPEESYTRETSDNKTKVKRPKTYFIQKHHLNAWKLATNDTWTDEDAAKKALRALQVSHPSHRFRLDDL